MENWGPKFLPICCQHHCTTTCIRTIWPYGEVLHEQIILWLEISIQYFPGIQEKPSPSPVVVTEVYLTCVVQVCFIVPQWWGAGQPNITLRKHWAYSSQTWFLFFPFLDQLFNFPHVCFSPLMSFPNNFTSVEPQQSQKHIYLQPEHYFSVPC